MTSISIVLQDSLHLVCDGCAERHAPDLWMFLEASTVAVASRTTQASNLPELITPEECKVFFRVDGVSKTQLDKIIDGLARRTGLPLIRIGNRWLIWQPLLRSWVRTELDKEIDHALYDTWLQMDQSVYGADAAEPHREHTADLTVTPTERSPMDVPEWMTQEDLAVFFRMKGTSKADAAKIIGDLRKDRRLPASHIGHKLLYSKPQVRSWIRMEVERGLDDVRQLAYLETRKPGPHKGEADPSSEDGLKSSCGEHIQTVYGEEIDQIG
jgi:hypothetical protein